MVLLCPSCNSSKVIFDNEEQSHCCSECGLVLNEEQVYNNIEDPVKEDSESVKKVIVSPLLEARYRTKFEHLQKKLGATDEETDFVRQLCFDYLSNPQRIFENSAMEVILCLFYLVMLQHREDQSLLLSDYCRMVDADSKRCLTIYGAIRRIVSGKLATLPSDYDPQLQLDNVMRFLYPALLQSAPSLSTLQHTQGPQALFYYHTAPIATHSNNKRINKGQQQQQRKRQKNSTTAIVSTRLPLSSLTPETASVTDIDRLRHDNNTGRAVSHGENQQRSPQQQFAMPSTTTTATDDDDLLASLGPGEPILWPTHMDDMKIRQQTTRLMTLIKHNGLAEGRYGRPLMSACLLITMIGWFHQNHRQTPMEMMDIKKRGTRRSRSVSMLPVVVIRWDKLNARHLINSTTRSRYKEVLGRLYSLGKTLPWLRENLAAERDVLHYLDDILRMMDVLQASDTDDDDKNQRAAQGNTSVLKTTTSSARTTSAALAPSSCDTTPASNASPSIGPCLPPSFERATRVRQKRLAELNAVDQWNHEQQQPNKATAIWDKDSGAADSVRMVARLVASQKYHREAILAMSDSELANHAYRVSTSISASASASTSTLDLDRQLDDFDLSNEELASYLK